jgi:hypothetical protein
MPEAEAPTRITCEEETIEGLRCQNTVRPPEKVCHLHQSGVLNKIRNVPRKKHTAFWVSILVAVALFVASLLLSPVVSALLSHWYEVLTAVPPMSSEKVWTKVRPLPPRIPEKRVVRTIPPPHLVMNSAWGSQAPGPIKLNGESGYPTFLRAWECSKYCRVYIALTNTGGPATDGNLIIRYDAMHDVQCENCSYTKYVQGPESNLAASGVTQNRPCRVG